MYLHRRLGVEVPERRFNLPLAGTRILLVSSRARWNRPNRDRCAGQGCNLKQDTQVEPEPNDAG